MSTTNDKITAALATTRSAIVKRAVEFLRRRADISVKRLKDHGLSARSAFPIDYNSQLVDQDKEDRLFAMETVAKHDLSRSQDRRPEEPVVLRDDHEVSEIINKKANYHADSLLLAYACKLTQKVNKFSEGREVASVEYEGGEDPWESSVLTATFKNGESIRLVTRVVVSLSDRGKIFHQFPTRLVKRP